MCGVQSTTLPVSPSMIRPFPTLSKRESNRGRKSAPAALITSSPHKEALEATAAVNAEKEGRAKERKDAATAKGRNGKALKAAKSSLPVSHSPPRIPHSPQTEMSNSLAT